DRLSARVVFGRRPRSTSGSVAPAGGMGEFIERLYERLVERDVAFQFDAEADYLAGPTPTVVATGPGAAAPLVRPHAPSLADALERIETTGLETVTAFFEPRPDDLQGFGVLFPRGVGIDALGVLFNTSIFDNRGPFRSETWIYSLDDVGASAPADARVAADREVLTGRRDRIVAIYPTRRPGALPVYDRRVLDLSAHLDDLPPWLALSGNYLGQIGISTLLARAETTVAALVARSAGPGAPIRSRPRALDLRRSASLGARPGNHDRLDGRLALHFDAGNRVDDVLAARDTGKDGVLSGEPAAVADADEERRRA